VVSIIGAGPSGNYLAYLLAQRGEDVHVYEDHDVVGKPIQCTGILTSYLHDILKIDGWEDFIVNTITGTRVFGPDGEHVTVGLKKNLIVDRALFDQHLATLAQAAGAEYHYNHRFTDGKFTEDGVSLSFTNGQHATDSVLVGSDGPGSLVSKRFGLYGERKFVVGVQARVALDKPVDEHMVDFYIDKNADGYIGWVVPENDHIARVGVGSYDNAKNYFQDLMKKVGGKVLEWQSGAIPMYNPGLEMGASQKKGHVFLVGDAATMVKATTYGGIIPGMMAADALSTVLLDNGHALDYEVAWRKKVGKELWLHHMIRRSMDNFSLDDYQRLLRYVNQEKILAVISKHDREYPSKLLLQMLLKEPRFLRFAFSF
jgi:digeranylgeranylglycerophospholipid reductase